MYPGSALTKPGEIKESALAASETSVIDPQAIDALVAALGARGFRVLGPTVREGAIVIDDLTSVSDLPVGWTDVQDGGEYRLRRREDRACFGYALGPHSWTRFLLPARQRLWQARQLDRGFEIDEENPVEMPLAFVGVRACEVQAIARMDRVLVEGTYSASDYAVRRRGAFIVAVNCSDPSGTCFCASMGTGPRVNGGYDLALTEVLEGEHRLIVECGSERAAEVLLHVPRRRATPADRRSAERVVAAAAASMGRSLDTSGIRDMLARSLEHPRWEEVAGRCLACGSCTSVCPTCFCTTIEDTTDLVGEKAERWRSWDSCFSVEYSYIHGGSIRPSVRSRYRQWLTHKFGTWHDQFGTSGCVGCGRCITWCPVAIDVTEELSVVRATEGEAYAQH